MPARQRDEKGRLMPNTPPRAPEGEPTVAVTRQAHPGDNQPEDRQVTRSVPRDRPFLMDNDFLRVTNNDTMPVEFAWNRRRTVVAPGETKTVIFQALVNKLGDPRAVDDAIQHYDDGNGDRGQIMKRYDYIKAGFAMYGVQEERLEDWTFPPGHPRAGETILGLQSVVPQLSVETEEGYPVQFPFQKPDMVPFPLHTAKSKVENPEMSRIMDAQAAENDYLRAELDKTNQRIDALLNERQV